jgi:hypothetical protein
MVSRQERSGMMTERGRKPPSLLVGLTLLAALAAWIMGSAEPVASDQAGNVAAQFVVQEKHRGPDYLRVVGALPTTQIVGAPQSLLDPSDGETLGYVYDLSPAGFVIVTSDTRLTPVIAFSYTSSFSWDESSLNLLLHMLRRDLALRLDAVGAGAVPSDRAASNESEWDDLLTRRLQPLDDGPAKQSDGNGGTTVYGPWVTTAWSQGAPWNDNCPTDPSTSDPCVVGCVATALAQILNYWQYPTSVTFTDASDYTTATHGISIDSATADFAGLDYNDCDPSAGAMASLSYAAGVSVEMDYTSTGSAAYTSYLPPALCGGHDPWEPWDGTVEEVWGYESAHIRSHQSVYSWWGAPYYTTETSFYEQLATDMTLARPVEISITASGDDGHAIVVDGWQSGGRVYHLNFGWGGTNNSWYTLPTGMPSGYNIVDDAVMNIVPTATTYTLTTHVSGFGSISHLPSAETHTAGTHVLITPMPTSGWIFSHWEGDASGGYNPLRVIMDSSKTVRAVFRPITWIDDMESGQNWTPTGLWHMTEQKSHSSTHSQWYGQEGTGTYETGGSSAGTLTSPIIDVSTYDSVNVSFWHWRHVWYYHLYPSDQTYAEYSLDGGGWTQFWYKDSLDASEQAWARVTTPISTAGASTLQLRFGFDTFYSDYFDAYPGWFIDDVAMYLPADAAPSATAAVFRVDAGGNVLSDATVHAGSMQAGSADVAEWVPVSEPVEPGDVVEFDPLNPGCYRLCSDPCSGRVAGVISTGPGVILGESEAGEQSAVLALIGIVPVHVTDEGGPIQVGDLLVSSSTPGHAMRWSGSEPCPCALVGKALEPMTEDNGIILVLLTAH